jgi:hypothetical protein
MEIGGKKKFRADCLTAGCYGAGILSRPPAERYAAWLMTDQVMLRWSAALARAFAVALGARPGRDWYEAQADHEEEADELMRKAEADRAAAEWLSGRR